jgi:lipopolysaccharide biosynthesis regulator YciM
MVMGVILGCFAVLAACGSSDEALYLNPSDVERVSTSPDIALSNFFAQLSSAHSRVEAMPTDMNAREVLVGLLLSRAHYLGTYDDFDTAFEVVDEARRLGLNAVRVSILRARVLSAVHEFDAALQELDNADQLQSQDSHQYETSSLRASIELAQGHPHHSTLLERSESASLYPSYNSLTQLAAVQSADEQFAAADRSYYEALLSYRDVSPFPIAWVAFQRGLMWGESADDSERAFELYQVAVQRLPQYVVGNVHLAELEFVHGEEEKAINRLEAIVNRTRDPEPASRLAEFLQERDPARAAAYKEQARQGYETYLERYPLAFADHAAEFYLGAGDDSQRALELALRNLRNRKTPRAYDLLARALSRVREGEPRS